MKKVKANRERQGTNIGNLLNNDTSSSAAAREETKESRPRGPGDSRLIS